MPIPLLLPIAISLVSLLGSLVGLGKSFADAKKNAKGDKEEMIALLDKATKRVKAPWKLAGTSVTKDCWIARWKDPKAKVELQVEYYLKTDKYYFFTKSAEKQAKWKKMEMTPGNINKMLKVWELVKKDEQKKDAMA